MTEVPVCESLRCVFYFIFFFLLFIFSFLCDSWLGNGSSCFLEVVASSAGEKGGAYGSQDSHQMVSAQRKKETQTRENNGTEQYLLCLQTLGLYPLFKI